MHMTSAVTGARILSFGGYQPARVVTNQDLAAVTGITDDWIRRRVGVVSRRIAGPEETVADMAVAAGGKALAASGLSPAEIDLVIAATCTLQTPVPPVSAAVAYRLGITASGAYDMNAASAGFCYALASASNAVRAGSARNVLVIAAEKPTAWVDWTDRSTCVIFGDGAGAAVVAAAGPGQQGIGPVAWGSAGENSDKITIPGWNGCITQEGQSVFRWAVTALSPIARAACEMAGVSPGDLAGFVPHQANLRIVHAIARQLGVPAAIVADDIVEAGNTSAASIPLALSRLTERGDLRSGGQVLLLGYGAGLTFAAQVITVP
jgi:3-oxoacyl-[acyl-carrier-protein] synthase III